jgi:PBP1b-binding outer membrane lipoprotein LpoB
MKNKFIILLAAVALVGCAPPSREEVAGQQAENTENSNKPQLIASTPQGNLYLIFVRPYPKHHMYDRIYFFDTNKTVTINTDFRQGKQTVTEASVIVNGKEYVPKN